MNGELAGLSLSYKEGAAFLSVDPGTTQTQTLLIGGFGLIMDTSFQLCLLSFGFWAATTSIGPATTGGDSFLVALIDDLMCLPAQYHDLIFSTRRWLLVYARRRGMRWSSQHNQPVPVGDSQLLYIIFAPARTSTTASRQPWPTTI